MARISEADFYASMSIQGASSIGSFGRPLYTTGTVYKKSEYTQASGTYSGKFVQNPYKILEIVLRPGTIDAAAKFYSSNMVVAATGTTAELSPFWYRVQNNQGIQFLYHESELLDITALRTYLETQDDNWVDPNY